MIAEPLTSLTSSTAHLGVSQVAVYRWILGRGLPVHKFGRQWNRKLTQVDACIESGRRWGDDAGEQEYE